MNRRPLWKFIVWLVAFTIEGLALSAFIVYIALFVHPAQPWLIYIGIPFNLIVMAIVAWPNIQIYFHPEEEEENE